MTTLLSMWKCRTKQNGEKVTSKAALYLHWFYSQWFFHHSLHWLTVGLQMLTLPSTVRVCTVHCRDSSTCVTSLEYQSSSAVLTSQICLKAKTKKTKKNTEMSLWLQYKTGVTKTTIIYIFKRRKHNTDFYLNGLEII